MKQQSCTSPRLKSRSPSIRSISLLFDMAVGRHLLLAIVICLFCAPLPTIAATYTPGDLAPLGSSDGQLNVADTLILQRLVAGDLNPTPQQSAAGDVAPLGSPDGDINAGDLVVLSRATLGIILLPPMLEPIPSPTNSRTITVNGSTNPNMEVRIYLDGILQNTVSANLYGAFSKAVSLQEGINALSVEVTDGIKVSARTSPQILVLDTQAPTITIDVPIGGALLNDRNQTISGSLSEPASLAINGSAASVAGDNTFSHSLHLAEGPNTISLLATDPAGNLGTANVTVTVDSIPPDPVDPAVTLIQYDNDAIHIDGGAGSTEPGRSIIVTNLRTGQQQTTTSDNTDGSFSVTLNGMEGDGVSVEVIDAAGNHSATITEQARSFDPSITVVGVMEGTPGVNNFGAATYQIPIQVPPGSAGMEPELSLVYNSRQRNGLLGVGWSLGGLSRVERCPATLVQDGFVDGVDFDGNDRYCLDGQRLIEIGTSINCRDGTSGTEYRTERESFARVLACGSQGNGARSFEVWLKNGRILEYGETVNSRILAQGRSDQSVRVWVLNRMEDRFGNYLTLSYSVSSDFSQYHPYDIKYTFNDGAGLSTNHSRIVFAYESRADTTTHYVAGSAIYNDVRLNQIQTYTNGQLVAYHALQYDNNGAGGKSRINRIWECDPDAKCLARTDLGWTNEQPGFQENNAFAIPDATHFVYRPSNENARIRGLRAADLSGDGRSDLIMAHDGSSGSVHRSYVSTPSGLVRNDAFTVPGGQSHFAYEGGQDEGLRVVDLDGDGDQDLLEAWAEGPIGGNLTHYQRAFINTGNGFVQDNSWAVPDDNGVFAYSYGFFFDGGMRIAELNGDGLPDLVLSRIGNSGALTTAYRNTGSGFVQDNRWAVPGASYFVRTVDNINQDGGMRVVDLNGDGLSDLLHLETYNGVTYENVYLNTGSGFQAVNWTIDVAGGVFSYEGYDVGMRMADLNGDGLEDLIYAIYLDGDTGPTIYFTASINTGTGFVFDGNWVPPVGFYFSKNLTDGGARFVDLNGDQLPDVIQREYDGNQASPHVLQAFINTGHGFIQSNSWNNGLTSHFSINGNDAGLRAIDLNGDGIQDLIHSARSDGGIWYGVESYRKAFINQSAKPDLLTSVQHLAGQGVTLDYAPLSESNVYTKGNGAAYPSQDRQDPLYVVKSLDLRDGIGGLRRTQYHYEGAQLHLRGRGFLGFRTITADDQAQGLTTKTTYRQDYPFIGLPEEVIRRRTSDGIIVSRITNTWNKAPSGCTAPCFPYKGQVVHRQYELDASLVRTETTVTSYDAYGNPENIDTTTVGGGETFSEHTVNTYDDAPGAWLLDRLESKTIRRVLPDTTEATRVTAYTYRPGTRAVETETIEPDCVNNSGCAEVYRQRALDYDAFGNLFTETISASPDAPHPFLDRVTRTIFDAQGRFLDERIHAPGTLAQSETFDFDPRFGGMTRHTDRNGLTTTWAYGSLGHRQKAVHPDGTVTFWRRYWGANGDGTCAPAETSYIYITESSSGAPPVTTYHDRLGREVCTETLGFNGLPIYQETDFDPQGRVDRTARPHYSADPPQWTTADYDELDRLTLRSAPDGGLTCLDYQGLTTVETRTTGSCGTGGEYYQVTTQHHDALGQMVELADADAKSTYYAYGPFGELTGIQHPGSSAVKTTVGYDRRGRRATLDDPDLGSWSFAHNGLGELAWQRDAKGQVTTYDYDVLGRRSQRIDDATGADPRTTDWTYDVATNGVGKLATVIGPAGYERSYQYDALSRPMEETHVVDGISLTFQRSYDAAGRLETLTYPTDFAVAYEYTLSGYLDRVREDGAGRTLYWDAQQADAEGRVTQALLGNGLTTTRTYRASNGLLESIQTSAGAGSGVQNLAYDWDALGRLKSRTDNNLGRTETFGYDVLNRLTSAAIPGLGISRSFDYDALGNLTLKSDFGDGYEYGQGSAGPHAVTRIEQGGVEVASYGYDANGNLESGAGRTLTYTAFNKPETISRAGVTSTLRYGPDRERLQQTVDDGNEVTTTYLGRHFERVASGASPTDRLYIYAGETLVAIRTGTASGVTLAYAHTDHLGSTDVLTDASGTVVEAFSFAAFGSRRQADWSDPAGPLGSTLTPRGYTGHLQLDAVGLVHMGARVYDPQLGRFLSPDALVETLTDPQALNRYSYVRNNPLSRTDPTGNASLNAAGLPPSLSGQSAPGMSQWQWDGFAEGPASRWSTLFTFGADLDQPGFTGFPMLYNSGGQYGDASLPFDRNSARTMEAGAGGLLTGTHDTAGSSRENLGDQMFSIGLDLTPWVGAGKGLIQMFTGKDLILGEPVSRGGEAVGFFLGLVPGGRLIDKGDAALGLVTNGASKNRALTSYDPPNDGFLGAGRDFTLLPGARVDRYGRNAGRFLAPEGTPIPMRSLPPGTTGRPYSVFEVMKPFQVKAGEIAPAYGQPGFGTQFVTDQAIRDLISGGYLNRVQP